jgi:crotonobetainyl-CoA:carnitine CoA-transferase CaiB-like acyl-CoA transferase
MLSGVRVVELADERGEFAGKLLAGLGAEVVKVEPPDGAPTRRLGPLYRDTTGAAHSLYFWQYNAGKTSVTLELSSPEGRAALAELLAGADVLLESLPPGQVDTLGLGQDRLSSLNPRLVRISVTPFGQSGPMRDWKASDLVSLAMGGVAMTTGYSPDEAGRRSAPIVPQMWHASHIAGVHAALATVGALFERRRTGTGQHVDVSMHRSVNFDTVGDIPTWLAQRVLVRRQTAQYAAPVELRPNLLTTRDGRYLLNYLYQPRHYTALAHLLVEQGRCPPDLADGLGTQVDAAAYERVEEATRRWIGDVDLTDDLWQRALDYKLNWAPVRTPEEALSDPYWRRRNAIVDVFYEEAGRPVSFARRPWRASATPWQGAARAPRLGQGNHLLAGTARRRQQPDAAPSRETPAREVRPGQRAPLALAGYRIVDLTWIVAGAGATRLLAALGAEVIKVEWHENFDALRLSGAPIPVEGAADEDRHARAGAPDRHGPDRSAHFAEMNSGKLGISLNLRTGRGRDLLLDLVRRSDVVVQNMAPGAMERLGLGYAELARANPGIIYAHLSGFGTGSDYDGYISTAPVAEAFTGLTAQSGCPPPAPPAGWGYPYLDIASSYYLALAMLGALLHRETGGPGQEIECSLADTGLYLTGTALVESGANGAPTARRGNRSPTRSAAPHGIFPCRGHDRWIAIAAFSDAEWRSVTGVLGQPSLAVDDRYRSLSARLANEDTLDAELSALTGRWDPFHLMAELQAAGVAAGVCQTSEDRVDRDPQLAHDNALVSLANPAIGAWPVRDIPWKTSGVGAWAGGGRDRGFPCYGQDDSYVYGEVLGLTNEELAMLIRDGVVSR